MKQTAVEWLIDHLTEIHPEAFEKAKEMEKEQIIFSNYNGQSIGKKLKELDVHKFFTDGEQYYNETFKSE